MAHLTRRAARPAAHPCRVTTLAAGSASTHLRRGDVVHPQQLVVIYDAVAQNVVGGGGGAVRLIRRLLPGGGIGGGGACSHAPRACGRAGRWGRGGVWCGHWQASNEQSKQRVQQQRRPTDHGALPNRLPLPPPPACSCAPSPSCFPASAAPSHARSTAPEQQASPKRAPTTGLGRVWRVAGPRGAVTGCLPLVEAVQGSWAAHTPSDACI